MLTLINAQNGLLIWQHKIHANKSDNLNFTNQTQHGYVNVAERKIKKTYGKWQKLTLKSEIYHMLVSSFAYLITPEMTTCIQSVVNQIILIRSDVWTLTVPISTATSSTSPQKTAGPVLLEMTKDFVGIKSLTACLRTWIPAEFGRLNFQINEMKSHKASNLIINYKEQEQFTNGYPALHCW